MKPCVRCKVLKTDDEFGIWRNKIRKTCIFCLSKQTKWRTQDTIKIRASTSRKTYYAKNKEKIMIGWSSRLKTPEGRLKKILATIRTKYSSNLDIEYLMQMFNKQNGRCLLTDIEFQFDPMDGYRSNPFVISIDKITPALGYVKGNVRLVCLIVNFALNEWGEEIFKYMCQSYLDKQNK